MWFWLLGQLGFGNRCLILSHFIKGGYGYPECLLSLPGRLLPSRIHCWLVHFFIEWQLGAYGMPGVLLGTGGMSANKTWLQILQSVPSGGVDRTPSNNQRQSAMIRMDRTLWQHKGTWEERRGSETSDPGGVDSYLSGHLKCNRTQPAEEREQEKHMQRPRAGP